jgi:hypothetical protein
MSMGHYPNHGYVVLVTDLARFLQPTDAVALVGMLEFDDSGTSELEDWLNEHLPDWFPAVIVYMPTEEDIAGDLNTDDVYVIIEEDDLYVKVRTPSLKKMQDAGVTPELSNWAVFA